MKNTSVKKKIIIDESPNDNMPTDPDILNCIQNLLISNYLTYSPPNLQTMTTDEKVDFLLKERIINGEIITYLIKKIKEITRFKDTFNLVEQRIQNAASSAKYTRAEITERFNDSKQRAIEEDREFRISMEMAQREFRQKYLNVDE